MLTLNGFIPVRESLDKMQYVLDVLYPQAGLVLELRDQSGKIRRVEVMAKQKETQVLQGQTDEDQWRLRVEREDRLRRDRSKYQEFGDQLMILRLSNFFLSNGRIEELMSKARKHTTLVVDLRGNPGGAVTTLREILGGMFEQDVKIADEIRRKKTTSVFAKGMHNRAFNGKLIVLVDSKSASAAEVFARVVQLQKRGIILGDFSSGRVMEAQYHPHRIGQGTGQHATLFYGVNVSEADFIMADGKSLEHVGVTPDEKILPSKQDLFNHRDPVLARAAEIAGVTLSPEQAGAMFPYEWPTE